MWSKNGKIKGKIVSSTLIIWDFNTLRSIVDRITRQNINKEIEGLNHTTNELYLTDIYNSLHSKTEEYYSQEHMEHCQD